jgi:hypothetical protein
VNFGGLILVREVLGNFPWGMSKAESKDSEEISLKECHGSRDCAARRSG